MKDKKTNNDDPTYASRGEVSNQSGTGHVSKRLNPTDYSGADDGGERVPVEFSMSLGAWSCIEAIAEECQVSAEEVFDEIFEFSEQNRAKLRARIKSRHRLGQRSRGRNAGTWISKNRINVFLLVMPLIGMLLAVVYIVIYLMK